MQIRDDNCVSGQEGREFKGRKVTKAHDLVQKQQWRTKGAIGVGLGDKVTEMPSHRACPVMDLTLISSFSNPADVFMKSAHEWGAAGKAKMRVESLA